MLCPFCLKEVKFKQERGAGRVAFVYRCSDCKEQVPAVYVQDYAQYPPVVVSAIGFRGHGKTVYFAALFYALKKLSPARYWREFYTMGLDEVDLDTIYGNVTMLENGKLPDPNPKNFPRPTMIRVAGVPMQRNCTLLCYDTGGECFERPTQLVQYASFVQRAQTAMFLISIPSLEDAGVPQKMHDLLQAYVVGMRALQAHTQDQHLVVVFTRADEMAAYFTRPWEDLRNYLTQGTVDGLAHPMGYMGQLHSVSARLHAFTSRELQAHDFMHMAQASFRSVTFSIISALGAKPQGQRLDTEITPKRVFDPLLWMMEKSLPGWRQTWRRWRK